MSPEVAEKWALEIFAILFRGHAPGSGGLLGAVEKRYAQNGQQATFAEVVGDGTLWMVLVATLGNAVWQGVGTDVDKAVALREVFTAPQLLASTSASRVGSLIGSLRIDDARTYIADTAPNVTRLLNEIEKTLHDLWESELRTQSERVFSHKVGDLLWREKAGWAICLVETTAKQGQPVRVRLRGVEKDVMNGYYVNVSELASRDSNLGVLIAQLRSAVISPIPDEQAEALRAKLRYSIPGPKDSLPNF